MHHDQTVSLLVWTSYTHYVWPSRMDRMILIWIIFFLIFSWKRKLWVLFWSISVLNESLGFGYILEAPNNSTSNEYPYYHGKIRKIPILFGWKKQQQQQKHHLYSYERYFLFRLEFCSNNYKTDYKDFIPLAVSCECWNHLLNKVMTPEWNW